MLESYIFNISTIRRFLGKFPGLLLDIFNYVPLFESYETDISKVFLFYFHEVGSKRNRSWYSSICQWGNRLFSFAKSFWAKSLPRSDPGFWEGTGISLAFPAYDNTHNHQ